MKMYKMQSPFLFSEGGDINLLNLLVFHSLIENLCSSGAPRNYFMIRAILLEAKHRGAPSICI